jgi:hypothetical protein
MCHIRGIVAYGRHALSALATVAFGFVMNQRRSQGPAAAPAGIASARCGAPPRGTGPPPAGQYLRGAPVGNPGLLACLRVEPALTPARAA